MKLLKFLSLLLLLLLIPSKSRAAPAFIQECHGATLLGPSSATCTMTVGAGHALVVSLVTYGTVCNDFTFNQTLGVGAFSTEYHYSCGTDGGGNYWTLALMCGTTMTSSGSDTFSATAFLSGSFLEVAEYSGVADNGSGACIWDGHNIDGNANSGPLDTSSITTTNSTDLLIATGWYGGTATAGLTVPSGYTSRSYYDSCGDCSGEIAHMTAEKIPGSTGTFSPTFAMATAGNPWLGVQGAFVGAPTSAPTQPQVFVITEDLFMEQPANLAIALDMVPLFL